MFDKKILKEVEKLERSEEKGAKNISEGDWIT
jgi:hypothetical protein